MRRPSDVAVATATVLIGGLTLLALAATFATPYLQRVITEALIYVVMVVGLQVFVGNSGIVSFGHVSFMVIGAYVSALFTLPIEKKMELLSLPSSILHMHAPTPIAAAIAAVVTGLFALFAGLPIVRLRGVAPSMALFALLVISHVAAQNWKAVTGGRQAMVGLPLATTQWTALACAAVAIIAAAAYQASRRGALLRCVRESEVAAESIGIDIAAERRFALVLSAMLCALGGVLFAHFLGTLGPNTFYLDTTFLTLAMLVVGGMRSLSGAVTGVLVLSAGSEMFRSLEQGITVFGHDLEAPNGLQEVALALIMLTILILRPAGICGATEVGTLLFNLRKGPRDRAAQSDS
jgi:branched-chain amino acid transport system permease protein